jgi:hypothetical protein
MYSSSLVCITARNYWLAAGSRSLRDLAEQGPGRFETWGMGSRGRFATDLGGAGAQSMMRTPRPGE